MRLTIAIVYLFSAAILIAVLLIGVEITLLLNLIMHCFQADSVFSIGNYSVNHSVQRHTICHQCKWLFNVMKFIWSVYHILSKIIEQITLYIRNIEIIVLVHRIVRSFRLFSSQHLSINTHSHIHNSEWILCANELYASQHVDWFGCR